MRDLDRFEQVAAESAFAVSILGNVHNGDFELVPLGEVIPANVERRFRARGLCFLGVLGIPSSPFSCVLEYPCPPPEMRAAIADEFQRRYSAEIDRVEQAARMGDSATWLEHLHNLPDTRGARNKRGPYEA
jgi:hypothetical protein